MREVEFTPVSGKRYVLVDLAWTQYKGFYAFPDMAARQGDTVIPTGHLYFPIKVAMSALQDSSTIVVYAVDRFPRERHEADSGYKANRDPNRPNVHSFVDVLADLTAGRDDIVFAESPEREADDVIAALANSLKVAAEVTIFGSDTDFLQLMCSGVRIAHSIEDGKFKLLPSSYTNEKFGVDPCCMSVYRTLVGDKSDNIRGIYRIPRDMAVGIACLVSSIDEIPARFPEIKEKFGTTKARMKYLYEIRTKFSQLQESYHKFVNLRELDFLSVPLSWKRGDLRKSSQAADKFQFGFATRKFLNLV